MLLALRVLLYSGNNFINREVSELAAQPPKPTKNWNFWAQPEDVASTVGARADSVR